MKINIDRLKRNILELAKIGKDPTGGITRLAYSDAYYEGLGLVKRLMEEAGMYVKIDSVGNALGVMKGTTDRIILIGSHTDTVEHGGMFDGALGVLGAIEVMRTLNESGVKLTHTVMIANWAEEEGNVIKGLIGSGAFVGKLQKDVVSIEKKLNEFGMSLSDVYDAEFTDIDKINAYLELHIEQGAVLDKTKTDIGVVSSIVGEDRYLVTLYGKENHAGTTPMKYRDDALTKAAKLILSLDEQCKKIDESMVCTVGWIKAFPGEQNIIPGAVQMTVEIRAVKENSIKALVDFMKKECEHIPHKLEMTLSQNPTNMSERCMDAIATSARELGLSSLVMQSGAGHDAMMIANVIKNSGMIFVPSVNGVSHCQEEWTEWEDVENGANVLLKTLLKLD